MKAKRPVWRRRALLAGGTLAAIGWVKVAPHLLSLGKPGLAFEDIPDLAPFRKLVGTGAATLRGAIFVGLEGSGAANAEERLLASIVRADPCLAFFGDLKEGPVPVAMFSDFACPVCRVMNNRLSELAAKDPDAFRIIRHELPILGAASAEASRAVLAADRQGAYSEMHERLIRTTAVTDETFIAKIAGDIGLDQDQLLADMNSAAVDDRLRLSKAIADVFGFYGTPAFAIGRTVFLGSIPMASLEWLIAEEVDNPCQVT